MGAILERCGLAEDMLDSMGQLLDRSAAASAIQSSSSVSSSEPSTGTVAAQVIAMALISMPVMMRYGYNIRYITGVLAASGTITQWCPRRLCSSCWPISSAIGRRYVSGAWDRRFFRSHFSRLHIFLASSNRTMCRRCRRPR